MRSSAPSKAAPCEQRHLQAVPRTLRTVALDDAVRTELDNLLMTDPELRPATGAFIGPGRRPGGGRSGPAVHEPPDWPSKARLPFWSHV